MDALLSKRRSTTCSRRHAKRRRGGGRVTYSPKVFIPLTTLCRDVCGYCTFARPPRRGERAFLTEEEVLAVARAGAAAGCTEALFTLGDKPELRYKVAREELEALGGRDDARVPRPGCKARARGDRVAAAPEPGRHDAGRPRRTAAGVGVDGDHARDDGRAALGQGRPALGLALEGPVAPARDDRPRRRAARSLHERDPDRDRRDSGRAGCRPRGAESPARASRPPAGGDRPELPGQAGHAHGVASRAEPRRPPLDDRGGAAAAAGPTSPFRRPRTSPTTTFRASSMPASTTGAASRR